MKAKLLNFKQTRFECIFNPLIKKTKTKWSIGIWNKYKCCSKLPTMVKYYFETLLFNLIYLMPSWRGKDCKINLIWKISKKWNITMTFTSIFSSILVLTERVFSDPYIFGSPIILYYYSIWNFLLMLECSSAHTRLFSMFRTPR